MPLITPEYLDQQYKLHATGNYGKGVDAEECARVIRGLAPAGASVLDYGCGQGHLARLLLPDYDVREYDPCIPGKDGKPEKADYVVCADVMEHIEPDLVETVCLHLRELTVKRLILVIATRESKKFLEDGRNVHLSVHDIEWWKKKFGKLFRLDNWQDRTAEGKGIFGICEPSLLLTDKLRAIGVMDDAGRNENTKKNVGRTWKRINKQPLGDNGKALIICGYGPSIRHTVKTIAKQQADLNAEIVSVSGAHDFLRKQGVKPTWHVECDPRPHKSDLMGKTRKGVKYLMASCCDPDFIKRIADEGGDLILWHLFNGEQSFKIREIPSERDEALIPGGGSVLLRALVLFYFMGYRTYIVHGFDCSFADDGATHGGRHVAKPFKQSMKVRVEGSEKWFDTAPVMVTYAEHMLKDLQKGRYPGCRFVFCGEGLFQKMLTLSMPAIEAATPGRDYFHLTEADVEEQPKPTGEVVNG